MGEHTKISWCDHTFNPVIGCCKISDGCKFCYALDLMETRYKRAQWGPNTRRVRTSSSNWKKPLQWNAAAKAEGRRAKVFCASLSDVFEDHPDWVEPRRDLFALIERTQHLEWLLLTKRPENIERLIVKATGRYDWAWLANYPNVWIGTSVENQEAASRLGHLLMVPAKVHFVSAEPLLGEINIQRWLGNRPDMWPENGVNWVICGGESGHKARPMQIEWARSLRDQCQAAGVAYFFKQVGGHPDKRDQLSDIPEDLRIREFPQVVTA